MNNKRVCYIEIEVNNNGTKQLKQLDGLAIKGIVSRKMGAVLAEARVTIANLTRADIEYLSTYTSPYINPSVLKKINIYAGYEQTGYGRIFSGDIYRALPSDMPDTWFNIEAKSLFYSNRTPITYGAKNTTMQETAKSIAESLNLSFDWQATSMKTLDSFNFMGSKGELIKEYNRLDDVIMFEDNGKLKVVDKLAKRESNKTTKLISKGSGMVGLPEPDERGIKVKCLLDPSLSCGDWVQVKSEKIPNVNGYYQIYELGYDFANREQQFYSVISAKRYGVL